MAITFGANLGTPVSSGTTSSVAFTTNVTVPSGGTGLVAVTFFGNATPSITGWALDNIAQKSGTPNFRAARFSRSGSLASGSTVTCSFSASVDVANIFGEYVTSANTLEVDAVGDGEAASGTWSASLTTTAADTYITASTWIDFATDPNTPAANYTEIYDFDGGGYKCCTVYRIVSSAGTYSPGGATTNGTDNVVAAVAYRESGAAVWPPVDTPAAPPLRLARSNLRLG